MPATERRDGLIAAILAFVGEAGHNLLPLGDIPDIWSGSSTARATPRSSR